MAQSDVDCANQALAKLGAEPITSLSAGSLNARVMNTRLAPVRRRLLRMHTWNFAKKRVTLNPLTISNVDEFSGDIRITTATSHGLTTGELVTIAGVLGTNEANGTWVMTNLTTTTFTLDDSTFSNTYDSGGIAQRAPAFGYDYAFTKPTDFIRLDAINDSDFDPQWVLEGNYILSDEYPIELQYIYDVTDFTLMDTMFYETLSTMLALDSCLRITQSQEIKDQLIGDLERMLPKDRFVDATEDSLRRLEANDWGTSRVGPPYGYVRDPQT